MSHRAAAFAATFAAIFVGHTVGDHLVQTDAQSHPETGKAHSWRAMASHVGGYTATCACVLAAVHAATGVRPPWRRLLAGHLVSASTHALIDRRWPVEHLLRATGSPHFAEMKVPINGSYQADQALHHACLLVAALIITGGGGRS